LLFLLDDGFSYIYEDALVDLPVGGEKAEINSIRERHKSDPAL